jgi:hypothetical protein
MGALLVVVGILLIVIGLLFAFLGVGASRGEGSAGGISLAAPAWLILVLLGSGVLVFAAVHDTKGEADARSTSSSLPATTAPTSSPPSTAPPTTVTADFLDDPDFQTNTWRKVNEKESVTFTPDQLDATLSANDGGPYGIVRVDKSEGSLAQDLSPHDLPAREAGDKFQFTVEARADPGKHPRVRLAIWIGELETPNVEPPPGDCLCEDQPVNGQSVSDSWRPFTFKHTLTRYTSGSIRVEIYVLDPGMNVYLRNASLVRVG